MTQPQVGVPGHLGLAGIDHNQRRSFWWTACLRKVAMTGWVSAVLLPMTMKHSRCSISAMELLIALEPMASCRPETLPAWQSVRSGRCCWCR